MNNNDLLARAADARWRWQQAQVDADIERLTIHSELTRLGEELLASDLSADERIARLSARAWQLERVLQTIDT